MKRAFFYDPENPGRESVLKYLCEMVRVAEQKLAIVVREPTRSLEQNDRMWALLADVSKQVQWPVDGQLEWLEPEDWKHIFSAALKRDQRVAQGIAGGFVILGQKTSRMSVRDMCDLQTLIEAFGSEHNVKWTPPKRRGAQLEAA